MHLYPEPTTSLCFQASRPLAETHAALPRSLMSQQIILEPGTRLLRPEMVPEIGKLRGTSSMGARVGRLVGVFLVQALPS